MKSHDVAIVYRDNHYGLTHDAEILRKGLESIGVPVTVLDKRTRRLTDRITRRRIADTIIHLERVHSAWLGASASHVLIPNQERFPERHVGRLNRIDRVLAKSRHAREIFAERFVNSAYLGFTSSDILDSSISKDWRRFFHLAGGSTLKGTQDLLSLWAAHPEWPELVLVQKQSNAPTSVPSNVQLLCGYVDTHDLRRLQNMCGIHLCPSRSEGWGHNIVEAMACGSVVVTTDGPPMNEHVRADCGVLVPAERSESRHLGRSYFIDVQALEAVVLQLISRPTGFASSLGAGARERFEEIDRDFAIRLRAEFGMLARASESFRNLEGP